MCRREKRKREWGIVAECEDKKGEFEKEEVGNLEVSMKTIGTRNRAAFVSANFCKKSKFRTFVNFLFSSLLTSLFCPNFFFFF